MRDSIKQLEERLARAKAAREKARDALGRAYSADEAVALFRTLAAAGKDYLAEMLRDGYHDDGRPDFDDVVLKALFGADFFTWAQDIEREGK